MALPAGFVNAWTRAENELFDAITNTGEASGTFPDPLRVGTLCSWAVDGRSVALLFQDGIRFTYPRADFRKALTDARAVGGVTAQTLLDSAATLSDVNDVFCSPIGAGVPYTDVPPRLRAGEPPNAQMGVVPGSYIAVAWDDRQILADIGDALVVVYREGVV